jgi:hypothetical protein
MKLNFLFIAAAPISIDALKNYFRPLQTPNFFFNKSKVVKLTLLRDRWGDFVSQRVCS